MATVTPRPPGRRSAIRFDQAVGALTPTEPRKFHWMRCQLKRPPRPGSLGTKPADAWATTLGTAYSTSCWSLSRVAVSWTVSPGAVWTTVGPGAPSYCTTTWPGTYAGAA